jgi:uncharacterized protein (DUF1810 family)
MTTDPFDLQRFVEAQDGVIDQVMAELAAGHKRTHWIWFIFPQEAGLGTSAMSRRYAIQSVDEARAYAQHPVLGPRLRRCLQLLHGKDANVVLGDLDAMKLRSCLRLFLQAAPGDPVIEQAATEHGAR